MYTLYIYCICIVHVWPFQKWKFRHRCRRRVVEMTFVTHARRYRTNIYFPMKLFVLSFKTARLCTLGRRLKVSKQKLKFNETRVSRRYVSDTTVFFLFTENNKHRVYPPPSVSVSSAITTRVYDDSTTVYDEFRDFLSRPPFVCAQKLSTEHIDYDRSAALITELSPCRFLLFFLTERARDVSRNQPRSP